MRHLYEVQFPYESSIESVDATRCYQLLSYRQPVTVDHFKLVVQKQSIYFMLLFFKAKVFRNSFAESH